MPVSFLFDRGRRRPDLESILNSAIESASIDKKIVSHGFASVESVSALQAADMVAHETYRYLANYIDEPDAAPSPHMKSLFGEAHDSRVAWFGRTEIQSVVDSMQGLFKKVASAVSDPIE